jgi:hypothetical protein
MKVTEFVLAQGHRNIQATHKSTIEITKDSELSRRGDCIIAVSADKSLVDLSSQFKENLRKENSELTLLIEAGEIAEIVSAHGNPRLTFSHPTEMVVRKSNYICSRTLAIEADKAACDLSRKLVQRLKNPQQKIKIKLTVKL